MALLECSTDASFENVSSVSIAIAGSAVSGSDTQRHLGLLYRSDDAPVQLIHQGWHGCFDNGAPTAHYCSVALPGINSIVLDNIADWLPVCWRANGRAIPYSFKPFDRDPFDDSGKMDVLAPGEGFTCATFVLGVFAHFKVQLISLAGWEDREEDRAWRERIWDLLRKTQQRFNIPEEHIRAQEPYVNHAARFRPEEVAGAGGLFAGEALTFAEAAEVGGTVLDEMTALGKL